MNYLYLSFLIIGLLLTAWAWQQYQKTRSLLQVGIITNAKVVSLIESYDDDGTTYTPVFEYFDKYQNRITFQSGVSSRPATHDVGDIVEVVYDPANTQEAKVVGFWGLYRWTIILLCIASPLLIIGGGYYLYQMG